MPRVLLAQVLHETNPFSVRPADLTAFRQREYLEGSAVVEALRGTNTEMGGLIAGGEANGWELIPVIATEATPCGRVTASAWQHFRDKIVAAVRRHGPVDAVLLALHGAMVSEALDDADGAMAAAIRDAVGQGTLIGCTLDLHANVSEQLAKAVNIIVPFISYPHTDMGDRGEELAFLAAQALAGSGQWRSHVFRNPQLDGCDQGRSTGEVMPELVAMAARAGSAGSVRVGICAGFPWADVAHAGPSVVVSGTVDRQEAAQRVEPLLARMWETRHRSSLLALSPVAACERACELSAAGRRVLIADFSDNPGGGGYGTTTALLSAMLESRGPPAVFAPICDGRAASACAQAGVGSAISIEVGADPDVTGSGPPLVLTGKVLRCGDVSFRAVGPMWANREMHLGVTALLACGTVEVVLTSYPLQVTEPGYLVAAGVEFERMRIVAIKSMQHFRAAFAPVVDDILFADSGGLVSTDYQRFSYKALRRPIWPLDAEVSRQ